MSRYERAYGTDWKNLDEDEGMERAYALGVAASLGEPLPDELAAIREEMDSAYQRSVIDLAFDEGKTEALEIDETAADNAAGVWNELVDGEVVTIDPDDVPTGGSQGLPEAVEKFGALDRPDLDSTEAVDLPDFLKQDDE
ncbi:hypothetical protein SAMN05216226_105208 [Halovenus aranensis]|uniref:Uncharacterized protein n=1 Tax=Halovenus aranensis TaxID=890420 RepID=A0A1G8UZ23_9EURY|nr:hypothetical protein [Halovenus aranensis]SDJ59061.1 hypothetical protein SAMN05216226_105208 [Halovenus aranensis]